MRKLIITAALASLGPLPACAQGVSPKPEAGGVQSATASTPVNRPSGPVQQRLVPGMAAYTDEVLFGDVWLRPDLKPRDRSLVTISVLIATGKTAQLEGHLTRALGNGVTGREASGVLTHLALYAGWPSAVSALEVYDRVYSSRGIDMATLTDTTAQLPPLQSEAARRSETAETFGAYAPKFAELTNGVVFDDLWRRSDLAIRDRSLVTIAALSAMGDTELLDLYLARGLESGLTRAEIIEALTHIGFYAGWAKSTKALSVTRSILGEAN